MVLGSPSTSSILETFWRLPHLLFKISTPLFHILESFFQKDCQLNSTHSHSLLIFVHAHTFLLPERGPLGGWPSWRAPRGCTRPGSGTSQRRAPARAAGRWWRWCGCVGASSWAGRPCRTPETCLHHSPRSSSARSALRRTCSQTVQDLFPGDKYESFMVHPLSF